VVIVLNYDGRDHLAYCLRSISLTDYPNWSMLVVDNASGDGSADMVVDLYPAATLIRNATNLGWSGGNNAGIRVALAGGARYVMLANNDIRVHPAWVRAAVEVAERERQIGVVGFRIFEPRPGAIDQDAGFAEACQRWRAPAVVERETYVGGMAMFVRAELFVRLGLIDEGFFAYGEENDFQLRAKKGGYQVVGLDVPVWHHGQASFSRMPRRAAELQIRNNLRLLVKHGSLRSFVVAGLKHISGRLFHGSQHPPSSAVEQRLRAGGRTNGILLLVQAVAWNLWMLPSTLVRRNEDDRRAREARRALAEDAADTPLRSV
jgi:hypothetical protein